MPYSFYATCQCGYRSSSLMEDTCLCRHCRDLVTVPRLPYRYELCPCPQCHSQMFEDDRLDEILGKGWLGIDAPSALTCPKCSTAKLRFHIDAHNRVMYGNYFPAIGELVDGRIQKNGDIDIPWFTLKAANVNHNTPADLTPGQRITWRVKSITTAEPTDPVQSMFYRKVVTLLELEYVGVLPDNRR